MTTHDNLPIIPIANPYSSGLKPVASRISLGLIFGLLAGLIMLTAIVIGSVWQITESNKEARRIDILLKQAAQTYANAFHQYIDGLKQSVQVLAKNKAMVAAIASSGSSADKSLIARFTPELATVIDHFHRVRFLSTGLSEPDLQAVPPLTETCLLLKQAVDTSKAAQFDIHGSPKPHLDLLQPVMDQSGKIISYLLVTVNIDAISHVFRKNQLSGYAQIRTTALGKTHTQLAYGDSQLQRSKHRVELALVPKRWHLVYWAETASVGAMQPSVWRVWIVSGGLGLLLVLLVLVLYRVLFVRLQKDHATLIQLFKDAAAADLAEQYPVHLRDCQNTIGQILQINHQLVQSGSSFYGATIDRNAAGSGRHNQVDLNQEPALAPAKSAESALIVNASKNTPESSKTGPPVQEQCGSPSETNLQTEEVLDNLDLTLDGLQIEEAPLSEVTIPANVFRAYDMRGIVKDVFTPDLVYEIGRAIGSEAIGRNEKKIVIARDGRLSGPDLRNALSEGLCESGCEVIDVGQVPTPVLYFAAYQLTNGTGVMLTGSHNPPEYNGIKLMIAGQTYFGDLIQGLRKRVEKSDYVSGAGSEKKLDINANYLNQITADVHLTRAVKVVVDCGNGVAGELAPKLLRELGCDVIELFCEIDGHFPNHHPDPSKPDNMVDLRHAVAEHQADLGVAFDGDGDRIGIIDNQGKVIWPDRVLMILAEDILVRNPGAKIIFDVKCTRNLAKVIEAHGGKALMWKTGHSFMKAKIQETGALLAGEMSGHIFIKERWYGFDDALYACARLLEVLSGKNLTSSEIFGALPDTVNTPELNINMQEGESEPFMSKLKSNADFGSGKLIDIDGIRIEYEDGWGLVRSSNTTPTLVLRFEAENQPALERIQAQFKAQMLAVNPDLIMPF